MSLKFNPFTGTFDFTGSGGGGGGSAFFAGEVDTYADLPLDGTAALNSRWLVRSSSGVWPFPGYHQGGIYIRVSTVGADRADDYLLADTNFPDVFSDAAFTVYSDADATANAQLDLSGITTGTTRTLTVPDKNITIADDADIPDPSAATPQALGTAAAGTSDDYSRGDHVHAAPALNDLSNVSAATPSDNDVLVFDTATSTWVAEAPAAGGGSSGTKTYAVFTPDNNQPTATAFATLDTRNSIAVLDFDDASTESAVFVDILPEAADVSSGLIVSLRWMATTATSGDVRWSVAWEKSNTDLDSDSFDTATAATATADATSGIVTVTNITCTTIDSLAALDLYRLRVQRVGGDGADTMTGDAELVAVEVRSVA
jgi:hypothetical protein